MCIRDSNKAVGEWEPVALADLLNDLKLSGYDVDATGFDAAEIDDLFSNCLLYTSRCV